jgi:diguanylate cyclase (GGDEF)-like protein
VLRGLATELRQQVRGSDVVGRFGGEEFVVLLPRADADEACKIAERLRHRASVMGVYADGVALDVTISIGVAVLGAHGRDLPAASSAAGEPQDKSEARKASHRARHPSLDGRDDDRDHDRDDEGADEAEDPAA